MRLALHIWHYVLLIIHTSQIRDHTHTTENESDSPQFIFQWIFLISVGFFVVKKHLNKPLVICVFLASGFKLVSPYFPKLVKSPHMQHELFLEDFAFFMKKSSVTLYLTYIRYLWHHGCDSGTYLQSPLTKPGVFGPEAQPKAIYCPRTQEDVFCICVSLQMRMKHHFLPHTTVSNTHWGWPLETYGKYSPWKLGPASFHGLYLPGLRFFTDFREL